MKSTSKLQSAGMALGLLLALISGASAQEPAPHAKEGKERRGAKSGGGRMFNLSRLTERLDLSDAQKQQVKEIIDRFEQTTKPQREEMRQLREGGQPTEESKARAKTLRESLQASHQQARAEIFALLTPEQRAKAELFEKESKGKRGDHNKGGGTGQPAQ